ncbi:hypothetical protein C2E21_9462 [Chlorella sorokiniana]|uniref:NodB homology domain-containing protein n=1 Tax=Chlorella sorokiniana TaxID=3076 RepID=A0A2P6TBB0_CHLSO|nr:hypothetical protein C2E21_9462 [Chlorella sorokiniana]|eukprot:PRW05840.1 hypothetical protein C2E21_9462 [Chlorella sorokiniana]
MRLTVLTLLAVLACAGAGSLPSWYKCTCPSAPAASGTPCVCPSTAAPGNLPTASVPQFVLFTHDDSVLQTTYDDMTSITNGRQSSNGCPAVATMFVTTLNTDCSLVRKLYAAGYEIADHTITHPHMNASFTQSMVEDQVLGARTKIAACGIPQSDIVGFRQPFLETNPLVRQVLKDNGFLYDGTILEEATNSISNGMGARTWPYTLQDGVPQNCGWYVGENCTTSERYAGMWEVPLWVLAAKGLYSMDYGDASNSVYDVLKVGSEGFGWDYALAKPNTYFITIRQLLAWMQNPVPAEQLTPALLGCGMPGGSGPVAAAASPSSAPSSAPSPSSAAEASSPSPATSAVVDFGDHDDSILQPTYHDITSALDGKKSGNGCPAVATMFVTTLNTDCSLARKLYAAGYEIADHTITHPHMNASFTRSMVEDQVLGARTKIAACGIPLTDIVGFRQPFLESNPTVRQVVKSNGFLYDSTILEEPTNSISNGMGARTWPYTLQDGVPQNCAWYGTTQNCTTSERYAGMWEVPLWVLAAKGLYSMDYGDASNSVYDVLKVGSEGFGWDYALAKPNTYFITIRQLLAWMQNPVPAEQLTPALLGCGMPGGSGPVAAAASPSSAPSSAPSPSSAAEASSPSPATSAVVDFGDHDDSILQPTYHDITSALDGKKSGNGCPAVATMFVTTLNTDCSLARKLYAAGYEIADHTITHPHMNASFTRSMVEDQVLGARTKIAACGIPLTDIVGFRQPFLESNPTVRQVVKSNGFLYDSTILEEPTNSISNGMGARTWPYTLQDGVPQNCAWYGTTQNCTTSERYAGMWEVPLWVLAAKGLYSMDYGDASNSVYDVLKANFDAAYNGNRAPMPIFIHTPWLTTDHIADVKKFAGKP